MTHERKILKAAFDRGYSVDLKRGRVLNMKGRVLRGNVAKNGYRRVGVYIPGGNPKGDLLYVHRMIAYTKFGKRIFTKGLEVRHLNNDKLDNSSDNIKIGTRRDNMLDIPAAQRKALRKATNARGSDHGGAILNEGQVKVILVRLSRGELQTDLANEYRVSKSTINSLARGRGWSHIRRKQTIPSGNVRGSRHVGAKLTEEQVVWIKKNLREGRTKAELARAHDVSSSTISDIEKGITWTHVDSGA